MLRSHRPRTNSFDFTNYFDVVLQEGHIGDAATTTKHGGGGGIMWA